eukprot:205844-Prymnesium_polylepis.2
MPQICDSAERVMLFLPLQSTDDTIARTSATLACGKTVTLTTSVSAKPRTLPRVAEAMPFRWCADICDGRCVVRHHARPPCDATALAPALARARQNEESRSLVGHQPALTIRSVGPNGWTTLSMNTSGSSSVRGWAAIDG